MGQALLRLIAVDYFVVEDGHSLIVGSDAAVFGEPLLWVAARTSYTAARAAALRDAKIGFCATLGPGVRRSRRVRNQS
jgi:hypothetical protein